MRIVLSTNNILDKFFLPEGFLDGGSVPIMQQAIIESNVKIWPLVLMMASRWSGNKPAETILTSMFIGH